MLVPTLKQCQEMTFHGASTIFDLDSWILLGQWNAVDPQTTIRQAGLAKMLVMILRGPPIIEHPRSVNNVFVGTPSYTAMQCSVLFLNCVLRGQSLQYVLVYDFRNMHAMSHRSDIFAGSSGVNI